MQTKLNILGAAVALAFSAAAQAGTAPILFDTNGAAGGGVISVGSLDWTQDNALAVGSTPVPVAPATNTFELYFQAALGNFVGTNNLPILGTGLNSAYEITIQMGFTEVGTATLIPGFGASSVFGLAGTQTVNFFNVYYDTAKNANQIAGTGYGDGINILSGVIIGNSTSFLVPFQTDSNGDGIKDTAGIGLLDNFGADDQNGTLTVIGNGGGALQADATSQNFTYILSDITSLILNMEYNTNNITPFSQANPSDLVVGNAPNYSNVGGQMINGYPDCGPAGPTCDFQFQADANTAFYVNVPEPGSLLLLGAGLMGMGWVSRRRKA